MDQPIQTIQKVVEKWAIVSIDKFQEALVKLSVGEVDGALMQSFKYELKNAGGNAMEVIIRFLQYGRFVDMGVGRGQALGIKGKRKPIKWYGKIKTKEISILRWILLKNYSVFSVKALEEELKAIDKIAA